MSDPSVALSHAFSVSKSFCSTAASFSSASKSFCSTATSFSSASKVFCSAALTSCSVEIAQQQNQQGVNNQKSGKDRWFKNCSRTSCDKPGCEETLKYLRTSDIWCKWLRVQDIPGPRINRRAARGLTVCRWSGRHVRKFSLSVCMIMD